MSGDSHDVSIRPVESSDSGAIADLYNFYVRDSIVTFEEEPVSAAEITRRVEGVRMAGLPWLIAEQSGQLLGYAYASPWKVRSAYRFSVEVTVYVAPEHAGRGIGSKLYSPLFPMLQARQIHSAIGGIALPNDASIALHEKFGLKKVAHFYEVGFKFNRWIDVGYWQRVL
jgi:phosphinothricin acetyltransferase